MGISMRRALAAGLFILISSALVAGFSYQFLGDPGLSLMPVLPIIFCGAPLSFTCIAFMRFRASQRLAAQNIGQTQESSDLIKQLIAAKGLSCPGHQTRMRRLHLQRIARSVLISVSWMTVFLGCVLLGYGVYLHLHLGAGQWYADSAVA